MTNCNHSTLQLEPSAHAEECGYQRPSVQKRLAAAASNGRLQKEALQGAASQALEATFPGPLILPGDDLALDSEYPPQSVLSWKRSKDRNAVTPGRETIYVARPPTTKLHEVQQWTHPVKGSFQSSARVSAHADVSGPSHADLVDYIRAFYHGLPVKELSGQFTLIEWDENEAPHRQLRKSHGALAIERNGEATQVRFRPSRDGIYTRQLNLGDILDALIENLPEDAYALLLIVDHDLYEDDDDDFCCGRAYGASRIAVVSTARYNPLLDADQGVDRHHAWPASHCTDFVSSQASLAVQSASKSKEKFSKTPNVDAKHPLRSAVSAYSSMANPQTSAELSDLWLSRVCKTASHELGHCMGLDHCVYYACIMQGSASLAEDARQPPYLCPVDFNKMLQATSTSARERYEALLVFCRRREHVPMFAALAAWIRGVLRTLAIEEL